MAERIRIAIAVDLDPVPGDFHTVESAEKIVQTILLDRLPHYNPVVLEGPEALYFNQV